LRPSSLFICWFHLLVRYAHLRGLVRYTTPLKAVGTFFIPIGNLVLPFNIARSIAQAEQVVSMVTVWQTLWIIGKLLSNFGNAILKANAALSSTFDWGGSCTRGCLGVCSSDA
jgi:hypothetical protein